MGVGDRKSIPAGHEPSPVISVNFPPAVAHKLIEEVLEPYAKPEYCFIGLEMNANGCEVTAYCVVPVPHPIQKTVIIGNQADIKLEPVATFLDQKAKLGRFQLVCGYHNDNRSITRLADADWRLILDAILSGREAVEKTMRAARTLSGF